MQKTDNHELIERHKMGQRKMDEGQNRLYELLIKLANKLKFYEACSRADCRRAKTCKATKRQKRGPQKGLITKRPICATLFKEELRKVAKLVK